MAAIFTASSISKIPLPFIDRLSIDKIYHVIEFAVLGYLIGRVLEQGFRWYGKKLIIIGILFTACYGVSDEFHQMLTPGRYFSCWDMIADAAGALLGVWGYCKIRL